MESIKRFSMESIKQFLMVFVTVAMFGSFGLFGMQQKTDLEKAIEESLKMYEEERKEEKERKRKEEEQLKEALGRSKKEEERKKKDNEEFDWLLKNFIKASMEYQKRPVTMPQVLPHVSAGGTGVREKLSVKETLKRNLDETLRVANNFKKPQVFSVRVSDGRGVRNVRNTVAQLPVAGQYSGTLGALGLGNICGPMSVRSGYLVSQCFRPGVSVDQCKKNIKALGGDAEALETFLDLGQQKRDLKLSNIHMMQVDPILQQKGVKGLEDIRDYKLDDDIRVLNGLGAIETGGPAGIGLIGMLSGVTDGYKVSFILLPTGKYERAGMVNRLMDLEAGVTHWINVTVFKWGGEFYWFIADSINGAWLTGNNFEKIKYMIYMLLGADSLGLPYRRTFVDNKNKFKALVDLENEFKNLHTLLFGPLRQKLERLFEIMDISGDRSKDRINELIKQFLTLLSQDKVYGALGLTGLRLGSQDLDRMFGYAHIDNSLKESVQKLARWLQHRIGSLEKLKIYELRDMSKEEFRQLRVISEDLLSMQLHLKHQSFQQRIATLLDKVVDRYGQLCEKETNENSLRNAVEVLGRISEVPQLRNKTNNMIKMIGWRLQGA